MAQFYLVAGTLLILISQSGSEKFVVAGPKPAVVAIVGEEIVFSCHLIPLMDAQNMEVRWYRLHPLRLVHHYGTSQEYMDHLSPDYQGRTEFLRENITKGQVALRIHNIQPSDEGQYSCFFSSPTYYSEAQFQVLVTGSGTEPHVHIEHSESGRIKLTCTSTGWYPKPELQWKDMQGEQLTSESETNVAGKNGLFNVETSIMVDETSKGSVSCFIRNPFLSVVKESQISLSDALFPQNNTWRVVVEVVLVLVAVFVMILFVRCRIQLNHAIKTKDQAKSELARVSKELVYYREEYEKANKELERRTLLGKEGLNRARKFAEDIILDKRTAHLYLHVSDDGKSVTSLAEKKDLEDIPERFDTLVAVLGQNTFSSGDHYWEVRVEGKNRWTIGLCLASIQKKGQYISACPENGFWALSLKNGVYKALSLPRHILNVPEPITHVGIFLEYQKGLISFYNVTDYTILYTFKFEFPGPLKPYFYPGPLSDENKNSISILNISTTE